MAVIQSLQHLTADTATDLHIILHSGSQDPASMGSPQLVPGLVFLVGCLEKAYGYNSVFPVTFICSVQLFVSNVIMNSYQVWKAAPDCQQEGA